MNMPDVDGLILDPSPTKQRILPFLKWAGGKRWLVQSDLKIIPDDFNCYHEPFVGGGAVFFENAPKDFVIADLNQELIACYRAIRSNWKQVAKLLKQHQKLHSKDHYYKVRDNDACSEIKAAARFIYLNRTCWNGLYRVNLKGKFNVPKGTKSKVILETDEFESIAARLAQGKIECQDFAITLLNAQKGDFVFVDPPYTVAHNMNAFVKYNEKIFSWEDQLRLRDAIIESVNRGVKVTATNADHPSVQNLYEGLGEILSIPRRSVISGKNIGRGSTSELLMKFGW